MQVPPWQSTTQLCTGLQEMLHWTVSPTGVQLIVHGPPGGSQLADVQVPATSQLKLLQLPPSQRISQS